MFGNNNPTLNENTFGRVSARGAGEMTVNGTIYRTAALLFLVACGAIYTWENFMRNGAEAVPWVIGGAIGGLIFALVTCFKMNWAPVTAPLYAVCEGLLLGGISAMTEQRFPGIVFQAVVLTFGVMLAMLTAYRLGLVRATDKFRAGLFAATGGIALLYLVGWVMGMFGKQIPYIHESGTIGIIFSVVVVIIAALNFVLDFDLIERGAESGAPKYMEWYGAFALMVTLIWLYLEILRLLSKLRSRN